MSETPVDVPVPWIIDVSDLPSAMQGAEGIEIMVQGANAAAARVAPCLADSPSAGQVAEAQLVLLGAVKRWLEAGAGAIQQQTAGPFGMTVDTRQRGGYSLWPSEIKGLQGICSSGESKGAFSVDTVGCGGGHSAICSVYFGAACSCGWDIAGLPLYEQAW